MEVSEIFSELSAHFIKGLMLHDQMADYYDFLSLRGYKRCHEYHFKAESCNYRKLHRYYLNQYNKLIKEIRVDDPKVVPDSWYNYYRKDVDVNTKRNSIKAAISRWVDWEEDTLAKLCNAQRDLYDLSEVASALFLDEFIKDVECELKHAKRKLIELSDVEFDLSYILQEQKCIHDKYKKKLS